MTPVNYVWDVWAENRTGFGIGEWVEMKDYCIEPNQSNQKAKNPACGSLGAELTPGNECTKSTACEAVQTLPRQSNTEFAQQATGRIYDTWNYAVEEELIRARDLGRAEGRAEFAQERKSYEYQIKALRDQLLVAAAPIYIHENLLELASLKEKNAWQAAQLDKMAKAQSNAARVRTVFKLHGSGLVEQLNISHTYSYADGQVVYVK